MRMRASVASIALVGELPLLGAVGLALRRDVYVLPPLLIFSVLHHYFAMSLLVAAIAGVEFIVRRSHVSALVLLAAVVLSMTLAYVAIRLDAREEQRSKFTRHTE